MVTSVISIFWNLMSFLLKQTRTLHAEQICSFRKSFISQPNHNVILYISLSKSFIFYHLKKAQKKKNLNVSSFNSATINHITTNQPYKQNPSANLYTFPYKRIYAKSNKHQPNEFTDNSYPQQQQQQLRPFSQSFVR